MAQDQGGWRVHAGMRHPAALLLLLVLAACGRSELSQRPPESVTAPAPETAPSILAARLVVQLDKIATLADDRIPQSYAHDGDGPDACQKILVKKVCIKTTYSFQAKRTGPVRVTPAGADSLRLAFPIALSGSGGIRGKGAKLLGLDAKRFDGALALTADVTPRLDDQWCPRLDSRITTDWTSDPAVEVVRGVRVNIRPLVDAPLQKKIPDLQAKLDKAIACGPFRKKLEALYSRRAVPVELPAVDKLQINVTPTDLALSTLSDTGDAMSASIRMTAMIAAAPDPIVAKPEAQPLPPFHRLDAAAADAAPPLLALNLPFRVPYGTLSAAIGKALDGRNFARDTPAGKVSVTVKGVELYPSGDRLVLGLDIDAATPGALFDTKGEVYLIARPTAPDGTHLVLADAAFAETLDSAFWSAAAAVFEGEILQEIQRHATIDLTADLAKARDALVTRLTDGAAKQNWTLGLAEPSLTVAGLAPAQDDFIAAARFTARATVAPSD
jgi:hypothetical protein